MDKKAKAKKRLKKKVKDEKFKVFFESDSCFDSTKLIKFLNDLEKKHTKKGRTG